MVIALAGQPAQSPIEVWNRELAALVLEDVFLEADDLQRAWREFNDTYGIRTNLFVSDATSKNRRIGASHWS